MKYWSQLLLALLLCALPQARGQFGSFGDIPIEINAEQTRFEGGLAIAEGNVLIRYGTVTIYADYGQYNPDTHDVLVTGNVRIFRGDDVAHPNGNAAPVQAGTAAPSKVFIGERAIYNLETKQLTGSDFHGSAYPFNFSAETIHSIPGNGYRAEHIEATTDDSSQPSYSIRARNARIYPNDRVIFNNVYLYVGKTPILWFPYVYQSLKKENALTFSPGYSSTLGTYLLTKYTFPISDTLSGDLRLDLMSTRGVGVGLNTDWKGKDKSLDWGRFKSYYIHDISPDVNKTETAREQIDPERYRVSFQSKAYLTEDIYASIDINKLSDARFLQDFERGEFRRNPNPDNMIAITKWHEDYTITLIARKSLNEFFDFTEKLPELDLDIKRQPIFGTSGFFYDGESSAGYLRRNFANDSIYPDYESMRIDSFHQIVYPRTLFGWLSVVPKVGVRGTYYGKTGHIEEEATTQNIIDATTMDVTGFQDNVAPRLHTGDSTVRVAVNAGVESSFKLSRAYEGVQSRAWGLDGLRHVFQPFVNFSYVYASKPPDEILQFDRLNPSTQRPSIDFPQFNAIDTIANWSIVRLGVHNRLQTRRDNLTYNWLEWNAFVDVNIDRPEFEKTFLATPRDPDKNVHFNKKQANSAIVADPGTFSNVYNAIKWVPVPWAALTIDSQLPLLDAGFSEFNPNLTFLPTSNLRVGVNHRYLSGDPYFGDSNQLSLTGYYRLNENWGLGARETYEFETSVLKEQRYELHRDLSSWIATFGVIIGNNGTVNDYGLALTFTLKDLPQARLPFNLDPEAIVPGSGSDKNP
jgi:lipopolysaccharide export system protein LptA